MPYNANIPQPTDAISDSQDDILNNFQSINTWVQVNHTGFDSPPNTGKHTVVEMPQQALATVTPAGEVAIECLASAYNTNGPELIYLPQSAGARVEMTASLKSAVGWTFIPSGLLIKWGQINVAALGSFTFALPIGATIPAFGAIYNVAFTIQSTNANPDPNIFLNLNVTTTTTAALGFNVVARDTGVAVTLPATVYYTALGRL